MAIYKRNDSRFPWQLITLVLALGVVCLLIIAKLKPNLFNSTTITPPTSESIANDLGIKTDGELYTNASPLLEEPKQVPERFTYDSGVSIDYPSDGVKGIYLSGEGAANETILNKNLALLDQTALNAVVVDVKDDFGSLTMAFDTDNTLVKENTVNAIDGKQLLQTFEEKQIYPIARMTTFKDSKLAHEHPERSFRTASGEVWTDGGGAAFINPYLKENWEYVVEAAKGAAKLGFKDIQFDYVRFPEAFETFGTTLEYDMGDYSDYGKDSYEAREQAISDFLAYARKELKPYGVNVSADIFGYVTIVESTPGIGQNFKGIANEVDVISSMIYPSHWSNGYFGYNAPDLEPYGVVDQYMQAELNLLNQLDKPTTTRPWLQDFTASYLGEGNYMTYDAQAVQAQIDALAAHDVHEYLLWNAQNMYTTGVNY